MRGNIARKAAAMSAICTLVWELYRDFSDGIKLLSIWALAIHFLYFQRPLRSRALAFFHPLSFSAAIVIPALYAYTLVCKPSYEIDHIDMWDLSWSTIVWRSFLIHISPLTFHAIDSLRNQNVLINAYQLKPRKFQTFLVYFGYCIFEVIYDFIITDTEDLPGISKRDFSRTTKFISITVSMFSAYLLHLLVLKKAYGMFNSRRS